MRRATGQVADHVNPGKPQGMLASRSGRETPSFSSAQNLPLLADGIRELELR
jgi:hypothetical protein